jgi:hypothetical protein
VRIRILGTMTTPDIGESAVIARSVAVVASETSALRCP